MDVDDGLLGRVQLEVAEAVRGALVAAGVEVTDEEPPDDVMDVHGFHVAETARKITDRPDLVIAEMGAMAGKQLVARLERMGVSRTSKVVVRVWVEEGVFVHALGRCTSEVG